MVQLVKIFPTSLFWSITYGGLIYSCSLGLYQINIGIYITVGTTLADRNSIQEEINSRLKLGNACYYSVQNLLSSRLLSKNLKIKINRTIILPVVLYGCET